MKFKYGVFGFFLGAVFVSTINNVIGADSIVVGTLKPDISFKIDGKVLKAPYNMTPINYNNYTYVPVRYISEMLGCEVKWNEYGDMIIIDYPENRIVEKEKVIEKIVYVDKGNKVDGDLYSELPVTKKMGDFDITINTISFDKTYNRMKIYFSFTNNSDYPIQIDQDNCILTIDNKDYNLTNRFESIDKQWYNYVNPNNTAEGYLTFDNIPEDSKYMKLKIITNKENENLSTYINFFK